MQKFDYIVVGAGSAGCVLADRLSADGRCSVLLLEAGGNDLHPYVAMPKGMAKLVRHPKFTWNFPIRQPRSADTKSTEAWIRGKGLGGSSTINGMIYSRGHPEDYEEWNALGGPGWGWAEMCEAYRAIECHELGSSDIRGGYGPLRVSSGQFRYPIADRLIEAGETFGLKRKEDLNDETLEGIGYYNHNIHRGRRQSAAEAFLRPALKRGNLTLLTHAEASRVVFDGRQAVAVEANRKGRNETFRCSRDIVLCAGTLLSPVILQRSGIGPADRLKAAGVELVHDSPSVGRHMREHLGFSMPHQLRGDKGINHRFRGIGLALSLMQYYLARSGPMATGPFEVGAFIRSMPGANRPDTQLYMGAFSYARDPDNTSVQLRNPDRHPGITIYGQLLNLTSEGEVMIRSADPSQPPEILPNWLTTEYDQKAVIAMVRAMRRFTREPEAAKWFGEELIPGEACQSDADILAAVRRGATSGLHGTGTCRMGRDESSVVDSKLRVRGVQGLRVADLSVIPTLISGNTNAPAMALGWRAGEVIASPDGVR